eukprot:12484213-Alexandrium_andersonii.AAC.1
MHPSRASEADDEAIPGPAQFKLRALAAISHFPVLLEHETPDICTCRGRPRGAAHGGPNGPRNC